MRIHAYGTALLLLMGGCSGLGEQEGPLSERVEVAPAPSPPTAEEVERLRIEVAEAAAALEAERVHAAAQEAARLELEAEAQAEVARAALLEAERLAFERTYPLHGVCYHFLAQVFARSRRGRVVGYMRRGATFRAKPGVRGRDCAGLWHEIPGDGYVCSDAGYRLGAEVQAFDDSPVQPALTESMPYRYAFVSGDNVPQFWRSPSPIEATEAAAAIAQLVAMEEPDPEPSEAIAADAGGSEEEGVATAVIEPAGEAMQEADGAETEDMEAAQSSEAHLDPTVVQAAPPPGQEEETTAPPEAAAEGDTEQERILPPFVRLRMRRGFYVSLDAEERSERPNYARTVRGGYIRRSALQDNVAPTGRGVILGDNWRLPIGFVYRRGTRSLRREREDGPLRLVGDLAAHSAFIVHEEFARRGRHYRVDPDGLIVRRRSLRIAEATSRPTGVGQDAQWIHVDLSEQTLVAYEGDTAVFVTMVASGKEGFETPTGLFRVESKHITTTMDDLESEDAAYSIEDVPWTMYFSGNFALHAAFWHERFGRPRSHGCVNLTPTDARWLFQWSAPLLPQGWHGMFVQRRAPSVWVYITE